MNFFLFFFFNDTATTEIYTTVHTLSLHNALPIYNLRATPYAVANFTDDVLIFASCLVGRKEWLTRPSTHVPGAVLEGTLSHAELQVDHVQEDEQRPRF